MVEYIEREAALNAEFKISAKRLDGRIKTARNAVQAYANYIAGLPAADVKPVIHGRWIVDRECGNDVMSGEKMVICSVCDKGVFYGKTNYCPNCGADMRGVNNERTICKETNCT